jgi:hypothetical protein
VTLSSLPQFTLGELSEELTKFNPSGLLVEVYDATIGEWVITPPYLPITLPTGVRDILLSLRPKPLEQFHHKPGFVEIHQRLPRIQRLLRSPSKRAYTETTVSPRAPKRVRHEPLRSILTSIPVTTERISNDENLSQPPSPTPHRQDSTHLLPPTAHVPTRGQQTSVAKKRRFPSKFPACEILSKVSEYHIERAGKHGEFLDILKRICAPHPVSGTTAAELSKSYKQNRPYFMTLDRDIQLSITWSELSRRAKMPDAPAADSAFLAFADPGPSAILRPPSPTTSASVVDPTAPASPATLAEAVLHTIHPIITDPIPATIHTTFTDTTPPQQIIRAPALFPLDADVLQPLLPEQRAILDAEHDLIRAISRDLGNTDTSWIEGLMGQEANSQLRCPFCNAELPGTEYSPALKNLLNSEYIQENTVQDPTPQNPNSRRSLRGHQVYSDFCSQHRLENFLPAVKAAGWPYPPNFTNLRHRVRSAGSYIDGLVMGIQTGPDSSQFYSEMLVMSERQRREQAQDIIAAG